MVARWDTCVTGIKHFHHPVVGDVNLTYDRMELPADPGLTIFTYTAERNGPSVTIGQPR